LDNTEGLRLGNLKNRRPLSEKIKWVTTARCLGIHVGTEKSECIQKNWTNKLVSIQKLLDCWESRALTLFGKTIVIKVLALSKIVFSATNTIVPENAINNLNKMIYSFLWNKRDRIKRNIVIAPLEEGCTNFVDVESFFSSLKASWMKRILVCKQNSNWNCVAKECLKMFCEKENLLP